MVRLSGFVHRNPLVNRVSKFGLHHRRPVASLRSQTAHVDSIQRTTTNHFQSIPEALEALIDKQDFTKSQTRQLLDDLMVEPEPAQLAAFLVLLRAKGETADEVAGLAESIRAKAIPVKIPFDVVDIVGTGGDGIGSVNISTGAAVISAAAGAKVAKHGSSSVSSKCGSADVIEAFGVVADLGPEEVAKCVEDVGIGFMFAPRFSSQMKVIKKVRQSLKLSSVFNILGPLLNPAKAEYGLVGVYSPKLMQLMANALQKLSVKKALIVHSLGLDELTPMGPAEVMEVTQNGVVESYTIDPKDYGIPRCEVEDLAGGDRELNAKILMDVFGGQTGPVADALNLNAGFALAACGVTSTPTEGVLLAQETQRSGKAGDTLSKWIDVSNELNVQK
eukprot:g3706.t1